MKNILLYIIGILVTTIIIVITPDINPKRAAADDNKKAIDSLKSAIVEKDIQIGKYQIFVVKLKALGNPQVDSILGQTE